MCPSGEASAAASLGADEWEDNVAIGNRIGIQITGAKYGDTEACPAPYTLQTFRNDIGVAATSDVEKAGHIEAVENGVGMLNEFFVWWPDIKVPLEFRWTRGNTKWVDSVVIGRRSALLSPRASSYKTRGTHPARCLHNGFRVAGGEDYSSGGIKSKYRNFQLDWQYVNGYV